MPTTRTRNGSSAIRAAAPDSRHDSPSMTPVMALRQSIEAGCLLTENEAARFLGVRVRTLQKWRTYRRGCRWVKLGRIVRYDPADLIAYIEAGRYTPSREPTLP